MVAVRPLRLAGFVLLCASLVAFAAGPARAADTPWDQAQVTSLAKQLVDAATAWELAAREQGGGSIGAAMEQDSLPGKARTLREMSDGLAAHLAKGDDEAKTRNQFRSIREIADDTQEMASRSEMQAPATAAWGKVKGLLDQLGGFYGVEAAEATQ